MRTAMSAAGGLHVDPTPDTSMLDFRQLRKLKRQDSGETRMGSLQPHPMRPFLWACKLAFDPLLKRLEQAFGPALMGQTADVFRRAQVEQSFCGLNRTGNKDHQMRLGVKGHYFGRRPSDDEDSVEHLWYKLTFHLYDVYGEIFEARSVGWIVLSRDGPALQRQLSGCLRTYMRGVLAHTALPEHTRGSELEEL